MLKITVRSLLIPLAPRRIGLVAYFTLSSASYGVLLDRSGWDREVSVAVSISTTILTWKWACVRYEIVFFSIGSAM